MSVKSLVYQLHQNLLELHSRLAQSTLDDHSKAVALAAARKMRDDAQLLADVIVLGVSEPLPKTPPCVSMVEAHNEWGETPKDGQPHSPLRVTCPIDDRAKARKIVREVLEVSLEIAAKSVPTEAGPQVNDTQVERLDTAFKFHRINATVSRR